MKTWNKLAPLLLGVVFAISIVAMGCGGGGSSEIEDACEDLCEAINSCANIPGANAECERGCSDDFDDAEELDGDDCVDSRLVAFSCVEKLSCEEILEFVNLEVRAQDLGDLLVGDLLCVKDGMTIDCCEAELATVIGSCEKTFDLK